MNRATQQLIRGAVLQVLNDNNVTDPTERERQLARAEMEALNVEASIGSVTYIQQAINSMEAESAGKSDDWKAGACAVIEALKRGI